jgi:Mn-containing catalase
MQYMFQAFGARGPTKYRDMLLNTATEELGLIEMLATAVALNLEGAPLSIKEDVASDSLGGAVLNGMDFRHILSTGLAALPSDANGVPFDASHVYASGNLAADMYANVTAESSGRVLAVRLYNMTSDPGMKDMLSFLIARDTMHQQQWLAAIEDMGGDQLPIPNSFPQSKENQKFSAGPLELGTVDRRPGYIQRAATGTPGRCSGAGTRAPRTAARKTSRRRAQA